MTVGEKRTMAIEKTPFGKFWNDDVNCYTLTSPGGVRAKILDYGAIIQSLEVPGRDGSADIVLGFDTLYDYLKGHPFFGAVAGRVANRIPGGRFSIDGEAYRLGVNAPFGNHLHGGFRGFDKYVWQSEAYTEGERDCLRLRRLSPHGEEGYPGNLDTTITYSLNAENVLGFEVAATTDRATIVNVVQHAYFNLAGHDRGDIRRQKLTIFADAVTPTDATLAPTGEIVAVAGTPFDFRQTTVLGDAMAQTEGVFDINYVLRPSEEGLKPCARLADPDSGRTMTMATTAPGLQFYNGHKIFEQEQVGKGGHRYPAWAGLCLETQAFPNAVNHAHFPSMVVRPGEAYHHRTTYAFQVAD
jgi:aldose 1-epimerase